MLLFSLILKRQNKSKGMARTFSECLASSVLLCHWTARALKRVAHTMFMRVLTSESPYGHVVSGFTTNGKQVMHRIDGANSCIKWILCTL
jgi:hypothetical protein